MSINNKPVYLCSAELAKVLDIAEKNELAGHQSGHSSNRMIIFPNKIDSETINPDNFINLKEKFDIEELLLVDRIIGTNDIIEISDHVNISGQNYLRASTPYGDLPQFPDMSKIYYNTGQYPKKTVYTVGPKRFTELKQRKEDIISEAVGLVAPVAHYVGIKVFALGLSRPEEILDII